MQQWEDIRNQYPHQWLLIEALRAHSEAGKRILDQITVIGTFPDSVTAMKSYVQLHDNGFEREVYVFHTGREQVEVSENGWLEP
jgi:hypothetical protein